MRLKHYMVAAMVAVVLGKTGMALAQAVPIPGSADVNRIDKRQSTPLPPTDLQPATGPIQVLPTAAAPPQSKKIHLHLQRVVIEGMQVYKPSEFLGIYQDYLDKDITLDTAWLIAAKITDRYQAQGYFLSRAYVPQQQIDANGTLRINVVEGYIAEVKLDESLQNNSIIGHWIERLKSVKPITSDFLESVLLQINDIPGVAVHATLEPVVSGVYVDGAVRMILTRDETSSHGAISYDNDGSRFLGPNEMSLDYSTVLIPDEQTTVHFTNTLPWHELKYGTVKQRIPVFPGGFAEVYGGATSAFPGYTLRNEDVKSESTTEGASLAYQLIRQRQENLTTKLIFESRDTDTDILLTPQTRDHVRAIRANANYETIDHWQGYNQLSVTMSEGLGILGSSESGDPDLSREQAQPWWRKAEFTYSRSQALGEDWGLVTAASGQIASGPLYSSEEFGYGGQAFGRAFDSSEIVGDHGIAGSVEMRYLGINAWMGMSPTPYVFYDGGAVFNDDRIQEKTQAASSTGFGLRLLTDFGASANFGVAFPVGQAVSTPLYGNSGHDPRYTAELSYGF